MSLSDFVIVLIAIVVCTGVFFVGYSSGNNHYYDDADHVCYEKIKMAKIVNNTECIEWRNFTCNEAGAIYQFCDRWT